MLNADTSSFSRTWRIGDLLYGIMSNHTSEYCTELPKPWKIDSADEWFKKSQTRNPTTWDYKFNGCNTLTQVLKRMEELSPTRPTLEEVIVVLLELSYDNYLKKALLDKRKLMKLGGHAMRLLEAEEKAECMVFGLNNVRQHYTQDYIENQGRREET